jgi:hypothetical protein
MTNSPDLIYLKDTVYNITSDLITGLNSQIQEEVKLQSYLLSSNPVYKSGIFL